MSGIVNSFGRLLVLGLVAWCASCSRPSGNGYVLEGVLPSSLASADTARLYVLMPEYRQLVLVGADKIDSSRFCFTGHCDVPVEAFVTIGNDSVAYCLVLSNNRLTMRIDGDGYAVNGSESNRKLSQLLAKKTAMEEKRGELQAAYRKMAADSTLTEVREDSLLRCYRAELTDFQQAVTVAVMENADRYPLMRRVALRSFQKWLTQEQADSLAAVLNLASTR